MIIDITIDTESRLVRSNINGNQESNRQTLMLLLGVLKDLKKYSFLLNEINMEEAFTVFKDRNNVELDS